MDMCKPVTTETSNTWRNGLSFVSLLAFAMIRGGGANDLPRRDIREDPEKKRVGRPMGPSFTVFIGVFQFFD